jgi:hypothetical protein
MPPAPLPPLPNAPDWQDLRNYNATGANYITSVKDQDQPAPCNACTAFAVAAMVEGTFNKAGTPKGDLDAMTLFTEAGPPLGCAASHWWPEGALISCQSTGLLTSTGSRAKIVNYYNLLDPSLHQTQVNMMQWINAIGPVVAVMVQYDDFSHWGDQWSIGNAGTENPYVYYAGAPLPGDPTRVAHGVSPPPNAIMP